MCGLSAVTSISECSSSAAMRSRLGSMPRAQCSSKLGAPSAEQARALQEIVDDQRLEDVELEVARGAADVDGDVVAHHLRSTASSAPRLRRVDLARHDRAARLVLGDDASRRCRSAGRRPASARRWRSSSATAASVLSAPCACTSASCAASASNLLARRDEGQAGEPRELRGHALGELRVRVEAGADRGAAQRQLAQSRGSAALDVRDAVVELRDVAARIPGPASAASRPAGGCGRS